jgi:hypothetical protein
MLSREGHADAHALGQHGLKHIVLAAVSLMLWCRQAPLVAPQPVWQAGEPMNINIDFDGAPLLGATFLNSLVGSCVSPIERGER